MNFLASGMILQIITIISVFIVVVILVRDQP